MTRTLVGIPETLPLHASCAYSCCRPVAPQLRILETRSSRLRLARRRLEDVAMGYASDPVSNRDDLQKFLDRGGEIRLVTEPGSGRLAGIALRGPGAWDWNELRLQGPAERLFRETVTGLIAQQLAQA